MRQYSMRRCLALLLCISLLPIFSGCVSLAREDGDVGNDQLIGIFIEVESEGESLQQGSNPANGFLLHSDTPATVLPLYS